MAFERQQGEQQQTMYHDGYPSAERFEQQSYERQQTYPPYENFMHTPYPSPPISPVMPLNDAGVIGAILSYTIGWFTGLLFFLFAGQNRYVRFHALQSLIFFGCINLIDIAFVMFLRDWEWIFRFFHAPFVALLALLFVFLVNAVAFVGWLVGMFQAARGKYYRLPLVGDFVAAALHLDTPLK